MRAAVVALLLIAGAAAADEDPAAPTLRVLAMKDGQPALAPSVKVGEPFHLVVTATPRADVVIGMPASFDSGVFEVLERKESGVAGALERSFDLTVVAWEPGAQKFPPIPVTYVAKGQGQLREAHTEEVAVAVVPVLPGEAAEAVLRPIAPPVAIYQKDWTLVIVAAAVGGAVLLGLTVLLLVRRMRRRRQRVLLATPAVDLRSAHEIALEKLRALRGSPLLDESDRRPFFFAATEAVREFLGRRFRFAALDMTTAELLAALADAPEALRADVERWFGGCDLVKFARVPVSREDAVAQLEEAIALVEHGRPVAAPAVLMAVPEAAGGQ